MYTILSLEACKQLKEWGCDVDTDWCWLDKYNEMGEMVGSYIGTNPRYEWYIGYLAPAYDLRDIICNGEIAKAFFGEYSILLKTQTIMLFLHQDKKDEAEAYLLKYTVFNPKNKKVK